MSGPFRYQGFGLLIESDVRLPELPCAQATACAADLVIRSGAVPHGVPVATPDEELAIHAAGVAFLIRRGREIIFEKRAEVDAGTLRLLLLGRVMGFLFRQRGCLPLHASGILVDGRCVLFLGVARAGKSTTAAAFHRAGHIVLTDDMAPVRVNENGACTLQAGLSYLRLREDSRTVLGDSGLATEIQGGKHRYDLCSRSPGGKVYPVSCAYAIDFGDEIHAEPVDAMKAIPLLSECSFVRHGRMTREAMALHLRDCAAVARVMPVRRLFRPRALNVLPSLVGFVREDLNRVPLPAYK